MLAAQAFFTVSAAECLKSPELPVGNKALKVSDCSLLHACELTLVIAHVLTLCSDRLRSAGEGIMDLDAFLVKILAKLFFKFIIYSITTEEPQ